MVHRWRSIGKYCKFIGQDEVTVSLFRVFVVKWNVCVLEEEEEVSCLARRVMLAVGYVMPCYVMFGLR